MKTAEEIAEQIENKLIRYSTEESDEYYAWAQGIRDGIDGAMQLATSHPPAAPVSGEELAEYKKPFRIGRKQKRAILDAEGQFVGVFSPGNENTAKLFCDWANGATLPTREQRGEKEKFAIRFSEWLMIQCEYKNHCVWEYRGEEYTQNELIEIFKRTTPLPSPPKH